MSEKDELLDDVTARETPKDLSFASLLIAYLLVFVILLATAPKIYIANEIYYTSRGIFKLRGELNVLLEENKELKSKLEHIRYKNQIIDNMN